MATKRKGLTKPERERLGRIISLAGGGYLFRQTKEDASTAAEYRRLGMYAVADGMDDIALVLGEAARICMVVGCRIASGELDPEEIAPARWGTGIPDEDGGL